MKKLDGTETVLLYVTKYALTQGVFTVKGELVDGGKYASTGNGYGRLWLTRSGYALTEAEALQQAEKKKKAAIAALNKKLKRLNAMTFPIENRE